MTQIPPVQSVLPITTPSFDSAEIELVKKCLASGWVTQGPFVADFERLFGEKHQVKHAMATTSCTAALHLATLALDLMPGDEVIVPAFTWVTSAHCAEYVGARAVFADIDLETFNLSPAAIERAITPRTRAIVVVHLFGRSADMDAIMAIARQHKLLVIEDAACAIGTTYKGTPVGGLGDLGCFSFHPRKVITTGEGGMVSCQTDELANRVRSLRNHGATGAMPGSDPTRPYAMGTFNRLGFNLRLSDIQAAVGVAQMAKLENLLFERRRLALNYTSLLQDCEPLILPSDDAGHTYQSYVVRLASHDKNKRNSVMDYLAFNQIQTRPGTHAVHRLGYYEKKYALKAEDFPNACIAEDSTITLPIFPNMSEVQQNTVVNALIHALK